MGYVSEIDVTRRVFEIVLNNELEQIGLTMLNMVDSAQAGETAKLEDSIESLHNDVEAFCNLLRMNKAACDKGTKLTIIFKNEVAAKDEANSDAAKKLLAQASKICRSPRVIKEAWNAWLGAEGSGRSHDTQELQ